MEEKNQLSSGCAWQPQPPAIETVEFSHDSAIVELTTASCVQDRAFPLIADGKSVLLASHTGSGKTLAYLLPLVTRLRKQEDAEGFVSRPKRPRVLVLSPTRELAEQIGSVAKQLAHFAKFRSAVLSAGAKCGTRASYVHCCSLHNVKVAVLLKGVLPFACDYILGDFGGVRRIGTI
jgi:hypothetical protein